MNDDFPHAEYAQVQAKLDGWNIVEPGKPDSCVAYTTAPSIAHLLALMDQARWTWMGVVAHRGAVYESGGGDFHLFSRIRKE